MNKMWWTRFDIRIIALFGTFGGAGVLSAGCSPGARNDSEPVSSTRQAINLLSPFADKAPRGEELINVRIASGASGALDLIAVGASTSHVYHQHWNGSGWQPAWDLAGNVPVFGIPSVITNGPNALDVFAVQLGGSLVHLAWNGGVGSGPAWTSENLGGSIEGSPAAISFAAGRMDVFVVGVSDGALYQQAWQSGVGWLANYNRLSANIIGSPAVVSRGTNRLDIFVIGADDNALYHKAWTGTAWSPAADGSWDRLTGQYTQTPAAVSWGPGRVDAFAVGADASLYHWSYDGTTFSAAESVGGSIRGAPTATSWGPNRVDLMVTGAADGAAYHRAYDGTSWYPSDSWDRLGGQIVGSATAVSWGPNRYDVLATGASDGQAYHKAWDASNGWRPSENGDDWEALGAAPTPAVPAAAPYLVFTCRFADHPESYPAADSALPAMFASNTGGNVVDYYSDVSFGYVDVSGSTVFTSWLPINNYPTYFPNFCGQNPQASNANSQANIMHDCIQQYVQTVPNLAQEMQSSYGVAVITNFGNFSDALVGQGYSGSTFGVPGVGALAGMLIGPMCAESGPACDGCPGDPTSTPSTTPFDESDLLHEMGHGFGFTHAHTLNVGATAGNVYAGNWDDEYGKGWDVEYGGWDVMACMSCPTFTVDDGSITFGRVGPGLSAGHISQMNWFAPEDRFTYLGGTPTVTIAPIYGSGAPYRFIRIPIHGQPQHYYTVELRSVAEFDQGLGSNPPVPAVLIHEVNAVNEQVLQTQTARGTEGGWFLGGDVYTDTAANVQINVISITESDGGTPTAQIQIAPVSASP